MAIAAQRGAGEARAIQQARVVQAVVQREVVATEQRDLGAERGHVAGRKQQRARVAGPVGERALQVRMRLAVAPEQVRGARTDALARGRRQGRDQARMPRETEVIVAAEVDELASPEHDPARPRAIARRAQPPLQPGGEALGVIVLQAGGEVGTHGWRRSRLNAEAWRTQRRAEEALGAPLAPLWCATTRNKPDRGYQQ
ncbi:MAG: hypothetical protein OMOMHJEC_02885 [Xanthomonadales bacterium]|nr:hypothetical protein [Xanthomonadales bacterium]